MTITHENTEIGHKKENKANQVTNLPGQQRALAAPAFKAAALLLSLHYWKLVHV